MNEPIIADVQLFVEEVNDEIHEMLCTSWYKKSWSRHFWVTAIERDLGRGTSSLHEIILLVEEDELNANEGYAL